MNDQPVTRKEFIRKLMHNGGLTYDAAARAYGVMTALFADAIVNGQKVNIGQVGALTPMRRPARDILMPFATVQGKVVDVRRIYHVHERLTWEFRLYRSFKKRHQEGN